MAALLQPGWGAAGRRCLSTAAPHTTLSTITELMQTIGSGDDSHLEVEQFLAQFGPARMRASQPLAVIKVGGEVMMTEQIDVFARGLAFLYNVGLFPIVVHGAGPQVRARGCAACRPFGARFGTTRGAASHSFLAPFVLHARLRCR